MQMALDEKWRGSDPYVKMDSQVVERKNIGNILAKLFTIADWSAQESCTEDFSEDPWQAY